MVYTISYEWIIDLYSLRQLISFKKTVKLAEQLNIHTDGGLGCNCLTVFDLKLDIGTLIESLTRSSFI